MNFKLEDIPFTIKESNGNIENEINVDNDEEEEDEEEEEKYDINKFFSNIFFFVFCNHMYI